MLCSLDGDHYSKKAEEAEKYIVASNTKHSDYHDNFFGIKVLRIAF